MVIEISSTRGRYVDIIKHALLETRFTVSRLKLIEVVLFLFEKMMIFVNVSNKDRNA